MYYKNIALTLITISLAFSAIITVDNKPYQSGTNYSNLQEAHDGASAGDTILVSTSFIPYHGISVTKLLYFIGVGFDFEDLADYSTNMLQTAHISGYMNFQGGSAGSLIEGFEGEFIIYVYDNNIVIRKNKLDRIRINSDSISGIIIAQNIINNASSSSSHGGVYTYDVDSTEVYILNNVFQGNNYSINLSAYGGDQNKIFAYNNVIEGSVNCTSCYSSDNNTITFVNNILAGSFDSQFLFEGNIAMYNICSSTQLPDNTNLHNILNVDLSTVFADYTNGDYHLAQNSPALNSGEAGVDMGAYGGESPFIDNGFPALPSIYHFQSPFIGSQQSGLDVIIKAKSNSE